jgi:polar amino acid transport system substrate-binding protein
MPTDNRPSKAGLWIGVVIVSALVALATATLVKSTSLPTVASGQVAAESELDQILKRGTIRCGYVSNPPSCMVDPNTRKLSGIFVDAIEATAKKLELKVEWTEEVGFGSMIEGLQNNRYDIVPCAIWPTGARAKQADFSDPLFYSGVGAFVRQDDDRFIDNLQAINSPDVKIATIDGEMAEAIALSDFPKAQRVGLPQLSDISMMLLNVKEGRADVTFVELFFAHEFLKNNPGSIKNITPDRPVRVFPNTMLLRHGQPEFKALLNTALEEQINLGIVDNLIVKYEPAPGIFYRLAPQYQAYVQRPRASQTEKGTAAR